MDPNYFRQFSDWNVSLGIALVAVFALAILWKVPQWQVGKVSGLNAKDRFDSVNEARKTLAQIIGGIAVLAGFYATVQNLKVAQENQALAQKSFDLAQRGQITDRFTKAIEQLGTIDSEDGKKLAVRLGGIYALKRIEAESEEYKWYIYQVLSAFVRDKARIGEHHLGKKLDTDIQAVITVLGTSEADPKAYRDREMDLSETDLSGANLVENYYEWARFNGAYFNGADLRGAHFNGAYFNGADLAPIGQS